MESSKIYCPHNGVNSDNEDGPCQIYCDGDDLMRYLEIYAIEGMNDITITTKHYQREWCMRNADLYCMNGFIKQCALQNYAPYQCSDKPNIPNDQFCETYSLTSPPTTKHPSLIPTQETRSPSINPTISTTISDGDPIVKITGVGGDGDGVKLTESELIIIIVVCIMICVIIVIFVGAYVIKKKRNDGDTSSRGKHTKMKNTDDLDGDGDGDADMNTNNNNDDDD
eukprot:CAMPEP_0201579780 /NCGR_PEP_ID=MMETSP0190_2-20130828/27609_1 /ASSEMBLY_ACC=CAM_ASM_000263 /TAXON_ID=37353 /ORGANISM="Rosalina sp." /LENGTH=224 /DNA_ID=CAMNT_0048014707 /DNA_START=143 /DNA_END=814 /DNA_ORIENTATION=+